MTSLGCRSERMNCIDDKGTKVKIKRQCKLLDVPKSSYYNKSTRGRESDEFLMEKMDEIYMEDSCFGTRRMRSSLKRLGYKVERDRIRRLMREMGIYAIYPKPRLSLLNKSHKKYPYLLGDLKIDRVNQVWCIDITYIPLGPGNGHIYLTAVMDWYSRKVLSWRLSNSMDVSFCLECLDEALETYGKPEIFNTDQGSQYTSTEFVSRLKINKIAISMDGKGRALDNRMVERLWRSVKYDDVYIKRYGSIIETFAGLEKYFRKYNTRSHQGLSDYSPDEIYKGQENLEEAA